MSEAKERTPRDRLRRRLALGWLALWALTLLLPVANFESRGYAGMPGWAVLLIGGLGPMVWQFGWYANIGLLLMSASPFTFRSTRLTDLALAMATLACAADAFFWRAMYDDMGETPISSFSVGFYAWQIVIIGSAATTFWYWLMPARARPAIP